MMSNKEVPIFSNFETVQVSHNFRQEVPTLYNFEILQISHNFRDFYSAEFTFYVRRNFSFNFFLFITLGELFCYVHVGDAAGMN